MLTSFLNWLKSLIQPSQPVVEPAPVLTSYTADWDHLPQGKEWTALLEKALRKHGGDMLKLTSLGDSNIFCPGWSGYSYERRLQFFIWLISSMCRYESSFKPSMTYEEDFNDANDKPVISRGLLQISIESGRSYNKSLQTASALHIEQINLETGVMILNRWIAKDKVIGSRIKVGNEIEHGGGGRYWSVLRETSKSRPKIIAQLKKFRGGV